MDGVKRSLIKWKKIEKLLKYFEEITFVLLEGVGCKEKESLNILFIPFLLR
jgi:hypothetical protein